MAGRTDREAIYELKYEYHRSLDADDTDAFVDVFTEDARIKHDGAKQALEGDDEYHQWCVDITTGEPRSTHMAMNPILEIADEEAAGRWQYIDLIDDGDSVALGQGYYEDEYRRTDDGWRIAATTIYRNYTVDLHEAAVSREWPDALFDTRSYLERAESDN